MKFNNIILVAYWWNAKCEANIEWLWWPNDVLSSCFCYTERTLKYLKI